MKRAFGLMAALAGTILLGRAWAGEGKGAEVALGGLKSRTPSGWKKETPGRLRSHQFKLAHADDDPEDAELAIFYFGKDGGGSVDDNIQRWKKQFTPPKGKKIDDVTKVEKFKVGKAEVTYVDISGTYKDPFKAKAEPMPNFRRLGAVFVTSEGPYYIRLTGPARTIEKHKKDFDNWLKAFK